MRVGRNVLVNGSLSVAVIAVLYVVAVDAMSHTGPTVSQRAMNSRLIEAAGSASLREIGDLLDAGADVNAAAPGDGSPLIAAARRGDKAVVLLLLERGADVNAAVSGDGSPLIAASVAGHVDIATVLLDRGAAIDDVVPGDENALIQASAQGHLNIVRLLVARGADVNARVSANVFRYGVGIVGQEWRTPLSMARRGNHAAVVRYLISMGARD